MGPQETGQSPSLRPRPGAGGGARVKDGPTGAGPCSQKSNAPSSPPVSSTIPSQMLYSRFGPNICQAANCGAALKRNFDISHVVLLQNLSWANKFIFTEIDLRIKTVLKYILPVRYGYQKSVLFFLGKETCFMIHTKMNIR